MIAPLILGLIALSAQDQQERTTIRVTTRMVEIQVVVQDKSGKPVAGLTRDDFSVTDRGQKQAIGAFSVETNAPRINPGEPLAEGLFTNQEPAGAAARPNITIVLFDRLNTHADDQEFARRELMKFLKSSGPEDRVAVVTLDHARLRVAAGFGAQKDKRIDAAAVLKNEDSTLLERGDAGERDLAKVFDGGGSTSQVVLDDKSMAESATIGRVERTLKALEALARFMSRLPGRKNLVWISGSFPFSMGYEPEAGWRARRMTFGPRVAAAARVLTDANVAMYPVNVRGVEGVGMADSSTGFGGAAASGSTLANSEILARQSMTELASATGGKAYQGGNDLDNAIRQAIDDSSLVYVLGYRPSHDEWDGEFRPIEVKVRGKGLRARYRRGYFAYSEEPGQPGDAALVEAAWSPLESGGVRLVASAMPGDGPVQRKIGILADIRDVALQPQGGLWTGTLDIAIVQQNAGGQGVGMFKTVFPLSLTQQAFELYRQNGIPLTKALDLNPAAVRLRIVVRDRPSGRLGSVTVPLE